MAKNSNKPWFKKRPPKINPDLVLNAYHYDPGAVSDYTGFRLYFPQDSEIDVTQIVKDTKNFESFLERHQQTFSYPDIELQKSFIIDYKLLVEDPILLVDWPNLKTDLTNKSDYYLNCLALAMHQRILEDYKSKSHDDSCPLNKSLDTIRARLINYEPILKLTELKMNYYGKLVAIKGTVIKASTVKILCKYLTFICSTCTGVQIVKQEDRVFTPPSRCPTKKCGATTNFKPRLDSELSRHIEWQNIRIQELIGNDEFENGRVPRTLDCEFTEDLVNSCIPGDDITVVGVLKAQNSGPKQIKANQKAVFQLDLEIVSVINNKNHSEGSYGACERITFNLRDYYAIQKIHGEPDLFRFLIHSLCPHIYGHEIVKAGLLLGLFGGTKSMEQFRSESHILMIGDPGLGKSQMLQASTNVAPRGVYVCGNTSTSSGLTVTMTRESRGEYGLEAGALMLADQGCCCIDEFDKMPAQHACLLEAMEQQSISIAKAGVVCTLPTRTTILAAANPVGGHYNKAKTVSENLKISSPMLSRFDLVFILLDQPNEEMDQLLSEHILGLHSGKRVDSNNPYLNASISNKNDDSLKTRLKLRPGEIIDHLPHTLFRKYIAYAQKYVNPKLSEDAKSVLLEFFLKLRVHFHTGDCTPITRRQLNSLIRLTQARAKVELREETTRQDALDVIELMEHSLIDVFTDNIGVLDKTRAPLGTGMSSKKQVLKLLQVMQRESENQNKSIFTTNEIKEFSENVGICKIKFLSVLDSLNIQGFLLKKGNNKYQLVSADF